MLICVSVYHDACLGHSSSAVMWQQWSVFLKRTEINWVAANWPFPLVYHTALCGKHKCQQTFKWICLLSLCLWSMILHLSSASSSLPQSELGGDQGGPVSMPVPLTKPRLCVKPMSDREVMWAAAFIWMLSQRKHSLSGTVQRLSVSQCVRLSFKRRAEMA